MPLLAIFAIMAAAHLLIGFQGFEIGPNGITLWTAGTISAAPFVISAFEALNQAK